jgi:threonine/homoserine/homoserine lactone efflux protein
MIGIGLASYLAWEAYTVGFGSVAMDFAVPIGALFGTALLLSRMPWLLSILRRIIKAVLLIGLILLALWFFGNSNGKG